MTIRGNPLLHRSTARNEADVVAAVVPSHHCKNTIEMMKSLLLVSLMFGITVQAQAAKEVTRAEFVGNVTPIITSQLCNNEDSPLRAVYKGDLADCESEISRFMAACTQKVVPETLDLAQQGLELMIMISQCLVANYQGGQVLESYNEQFTGQLMLERDRWLTNLEPVMMRNMCEQKESDFGRVYKGSNCRKDVKDLFTKCTTSVDNVVIPESLAGFSQADHYGQIIAACITAHYLGGEALQYFNAMEPR